MNMSARHQTLQRVRQACCLSAALALAIPIASQAQGLNNAAEEFPFQVVRTIAHYNINTDGTYSEVRTSERKVLARSGVESLRRDSFSFSTSAQTGRIEEAYTLKPDGTRVDVRPDSYQLEVNKGVEAGKPAYSDRTTLSVVFPGVEVGSTVVFKYRVDTKTPIFALAVQLTC